MKKNYFVKPLTFVLLLSMISLTTNAQAPLLHYTFDDITTNNGSAGAAGDLAVLDGGTAAYATGQFNNGYVGDGLNYLATTWAGITGSQARTVTGWIKVPDVAVKGMAVELGRRDGVNGQRFSVLFSASSGALTLACGGKAKVLSTSQLVAGQWAFFAITHDGAGFVTGTTIIVDNGTDGDVSNTGTDTTVAVDTQYNNPALSTTVLCANNGGVVSDKTIASVDDIRVFDSALSLSNIALIKGGATLGADDISFGENELRAFPTLVTDVLNIETTVNEKVDVRIYSLLGKLSHKAYGKTIDMSHLSSGLYIVKVRAGAKVASLKVVKK